jgi:2-aminoadipate transaminase
MYEPEFRTVTLLNDGVDLEQLDRATRADQAKLFYALPNFQNPSGITYSADKRVEVARIVRANNVFLIEDDPYRELRFLGDDLPTIVQGARDNSFLLGSFSKIVAPALRMGWLTTPPRLLDTVVIAKQAADLHSNYITQRILYRYLQDNDVDAHVSLIRNAYGEQRELMVAMLQERFPANIEFTLPEGGMFLWVTLPTGISSLELFDEAAKRDVVFVPGAPFFVDGGGDRALRLNFSNTDTSLIEEGMTRLAEAFASLQGRSV